MRTRLAGGRDAEAFANLESMVIPKLFDGRGADDILRIWVPSCAAGEEVYSISISAVRAHGSVERRPRVQIFATDIDERALTVARAGRYPAALLESVSPERTERFFTLDGSSHVVSKEVRPRLTGCGLDLPCKPHPEAHHPAAVRYVSLSNACSLRRLTWWWTPKATSSSTRHAPGNILRLQPAYRPAKSSRSHARG